jgi:hypothetical protein
MTARVRQEQSSPRGGPRAGGTRVGGAPQPTGRRQLTALYTRLPLLQLTGERGFGLQEIGCADGYLTDTLSWSLDLCVAT